MESISTTLMNQDGTLRMALFVALLAVLGVAETVRRRRRLTRGLSLLRMHPLEDSTT